MKNSQKSRRHFLRGAGVALALPWLESLPLLAQDAPVARPPNPNKAPLRFACIYFSNGVDPTHYWAKGAARPWNSVPPPNRSRPSAKTWFSSAVSTTRPRSSPPAPTWAA